MVDEALDDLNLGDLIATLGSIDDDEIDWQNVARTTVLIHQTFRYEYPGPIAALRQRLMVVPPDYHDDQRLVTHKLRVSGCERRHRALVRHLRERRARPDAAARRARGRVHELDRRRARGGRGRRALLRAAPTRRPLLGALAADPSRRRAHGGRGGAPGDGCDRARARRPRQRARPRPPPLRLGGRPRSRRRPPRRGPAAPASARTTPTACSRSRGSAASPPATSPATCSAKAAPTPGSRSSSRIREQPECVSAVRVRSDPRPARRAPVRHRRRRPRLRRRRPDLGHLRRASTRAC